jgi:hypothetical protein
MQKGKTYSRAAMMVMTTAESSVYYGTENEEEK